MVSESFCFLSELTFKDVAAENLALGLGGGESRIHAGRRRIDDVTIFRAPFVAKFGGVRLDVTVGRQKVVLLFLIVSTAETWRRKGAKDDTWSGLEGGLKGALEGNASII